MYAPSPARRLSGLLLAVSIAFCGSAGATTDPGIVTVKTTYAFKMLVRRVEDAIPNHALALICEASASHGAEARGIHIPGNMVLMVFRNDYAVRMLKADVAAGIEAPLRIYLTENADGTANLTYRRPSSTFAPYDNQVLNALAAELDPLMAAIAADAARH